MAWASARCKAQALRGAVLSGSKQLPATRSPATHRGPLRGAAHTPTRSLRLPGGLCSPLPPRAVAPSFAFSRCAVHRISDRPVANHRGPSPGPPSPPAAGARAERVIITADPSLCTALRRVAPQHSAHHRGPFGPRQPTTEPAFSGGLIAHRRRHDSPRTASHRASSRRTSQAPAPAGAPPPTTSPP